MPSDRIRTEAALVMTEAEWRRAMNDKAYRPRLAESSLAMVVYDEGYAVVRADGKPVSATANSAEAQALVRAVCEGRA